jgi:hypothetical protein
MLDEPALIAITRGGSDMRLNVVLQWPAAQIGRRELWPR